MSEFLIRTFVIIGVIVVLIKQYFLSTRRHWGFGALPPIIYVGFSAWYAATKNVDTYRTVKLFVGVVVFLSIWCEGRAKVKRIFLKR